MATVALSNITIMATAMTAIRPSITTETVSSRTKILVNSNYLVT